MMKGICLEEQRGRGREKVPEGEGRQWVEDRRRPRRTEGCVFEVCISRDVRRKGQTSPSSSCRWGRVESSCTQRSGSSRRRWSCKRIRHDVFHDLNWDTLSYMRGREGEQAIDKIEARSSSR